MLFRLSNAPVSFQGYIKKISVEKLEIFVIVYLDEILIYIEDSDQRHMKTIWWILNSLRENSLFANLKKCWFYKDEMQFLGYVISS